MRKLRFLWRKAIARAIAGLFITFIAGAALPLTLPPLQLVDEAGRPVADVVARIDGASANVPQLSSEAVMDQSNLSFSPQVLAVSTGTAVRFPNSDETRHHVYSFSPAKTFELQLFRGNDAPPVEFDRAGVVVVGCNIHDAMLGYIHVFDGDVYGISDARGLLSLPAFRAEDTAKLILWHSQLSESLALPLSQFDATGDAFRLKLPFTQRLAEPEPASGGLRNRLEQYNLHDN